MIEAQHGFQDGTGGPTVLERVAPGTGEILDGWEAAKVAPTGQQGDGLFAATDGSGAFGVDLYDQPNVIARLAMVGGDFKTEALLAEDASEGRDYDEAASIDLLSTPNRATKEAATLNVFAAGSPVTQLTGATHLYAALYAHEVGGPSKDQQGEVEPWEAWTGGSAPEAWITGKEGASFDHAWAHIGIRLFEADGRIADTLGGGEPNAPGQSQLGTCSVDYARASLAAGADGAVFVLTQPNLEAVGPHKESLATDDEVIEFAPGGEHACPSVTHEIEVNGEELHAESGEPMPTVTVNEGVKTKFDAISLDRPLAWSPSWVFTWKPEPLEWTPFAFEWGWNFKGEPTAGPNKDGYTEIEKIKPGSEKNYLWPKPEAEHEYTKPGTYEARLRVYGDYGTSVFPVKVIVSGGGSPIASFTTPARVTAGTAAVFDAAASTPAPGGPTIEDYHWEFGDGSKPVNTNSRTQSHTFAKAGEYEVTLTVRDNEGADSRETVEHVVTVEPAAEKHEEPSKEEKREEPQKVEESPAAVSTPAPKSEAPAKPPAATIAPHVKKAPPTKAEKLSAALKACKKLRARGRRASCERQARKRYGPVVKRYGPVVKRYGPVVKRGDKRK